MLDVPLFAVSQLNLCLLLADTGSLSALLAWFRPWLFTDAGQLSAYFARFLRRLYALARKTTTFWTVLWLWFTVPLRITEMVVRLNEVEDGEVVLTVIKPCTTPDDLLELDHGIDRPHQYDVADITSVNAGG